MEIVNNFMDLAISVNAAISFYLYHTVSYINVVSKRNKIPLINQEYYV